MDKELKTRKELIEKLESNKQDNEPEVISETVVSGDLDFADLLALSLLLKEL